MPITLRYAFFHLLTGLTLPDPPYLVAGFAPSPTSLSLTSRKPASFAELAIGSVISLHCIYTVLSSASHIPWDWKTRLIQQTGRIAAGVKWGRVCRQNSSVNDSFTTTYVRIPSENFHDVYLNKEHHRYIWMINMKAHIQRENKYIHVFFHCNFSFSG